MDTAASCTHDIPEVHTRLTVMAGTVSGMPAKRAPTRATFRELTSGKQEPKRMSPWEVRKEARGKVREGVWVEEWEEVWEVCVTMWVCGGPEEV